MNNTNYIVYNAEPEHDFVTLVQLIISISMINFVVRSITCISGECWKQAEYEDRIKFLEDELDELTEELKNANEHIAEIEETYRACREAAEVFIKTLPESDSEEDQEESKEHTD